MNLIDQRWVPTTKGLMSLEEVFRHGWEASLAGNPEHQVSVIRLLLCISQAATEWPDKSSWIAQKESFPVDALRYLQDWKPKFELYGEFLQDKSLTPSTKPNGDLMNGGSLPHLDITKMNGTQVHYLASMRPGEPSPEELALLVLTFQNFSPSETKGWRRGQVGPAQGALGYLHSFLAGSSLLDMVHNNILLEEEAAAFLKGKGRPVWETGTAVPDTLLGALVPQSRRLLIKEGDPVMLMEDGPSYQGVEMPSITVKERKADKVKFLWTDPAKKSWRELPALLQFLDGGEGCRQLATCLPRVSEKDGGAGIACLGVRCTIKTGAQQFSGDSAGLSSNTYLPASAVGTEWYQGMHRRVQDLEDVESRLRKAVYSFWAHMKAEKKTCAGYASAASRLWWDYAETRAGDVIAGTSPMVLEELLAAARTILPRICPTNTPRALRAFVAAEKHLKQERRS